MAVFDASALLAVALDEPGGDVVQDSLNNGFISALISCEVQTRLIGNGMPADAAQLTMEQFELSIMPFEPADASQAAALYPQTSSRRLSLADRACLVLARRLRQPVYTADRSWATLDLGLDIRLIR